MENITLIENKDVMQDQIYQLKLKEVGTLTEYII